MNRKVASNDDGLTKDKVTGMDDLLRNIVDDVNHQNRAIEFVNRKPLSEFTKNRKIVIVRQAELARVDTNQDKGVLLASDEATTCIIAVAHCHESSLASIAHFDDGTTNQSSIDRWLDGMHRPSVFLLGDYLLNSNRRESLSSAILWLLQQRKDLVVNLELCCVQGLNTKEDGFPLVYDLMYDVDTQTAFPVIPEGVSAPAIHERRAFHHEMSIDSGLLEIYHNQRICLPAFYVKPQSYMSYFLTASDSTILDLFSTSPFHEKESFVEDLRSFWSWNLSLQESDRNIPELIFEWIGDTGWTKVND